jgi:uncharacterized membrane protein
VELIPVLRMHTKRHTVELDAAYIVILVSHLGYSAVLINETLWLHVDSTVRALGLLAGGDSCIEAHPV